MRNFPAFSYSEMSSLDPFVGAAPSKVSSSGCFAVVHTLNGMSEIEVQVKKHYYPKTNSLIKFWF